MAVGGLIGLTVGTISGVSQGKTGWELVGYMGLGAVAGVATAGVGHLAAGLVTNPGLGGAVMQGMVRGAAGGFVGGGITGVGVGLLQGKSPQEVLKYGLVGAVAGGAIGAVSGTISHYIRRGVTQVAGQQAGQVTGQVSRAAINETALKPTSQAMQQAVKESPLFNTPTAGGPVGQPLPLTDVAPQIQIAPDVMSRTYTSTINPLTGNAVNFTTVNTVQIMPQGVIVTEGFQTTFIPWAAIP